jgi:hypothetical protein
MLFEKTRKQMAKIGLPMGDPQDFKSKLKFPDGADFRIEVPTVNSVEAFKQLLKTAKENGVTINRIDDTFGIVRYTTKEIKEYAKIGNDNGVEVNFSVGPRATYDTSATRLTPEGVRIGYRLRGMDQVVRATEDVYRAIELGIKGILVYDEGHLWVLNELRKAGDIPAYVRFKFSAHNGAGNPASFKVMVGLGADSINPVRDLTIPMMASLRQAVSVPLDLHTDNPAGSGGFIRTYEAPEIVIVGAPVHLKAGNSALRGHGIKTSAAEAEQMALQASLVAEMVRRYLPEATQSPAGTPDQAIPDIV